MSALLTADLTGFAKLGIGAALLEAAGIERVTGVQARDRFGIKHSGDLDGIIFPYANPTTGKRVTARLRRDNPPVEAGKPQDKYISAHGDRKHLYFPPDCAALLSDMTAPVVIVEAEKSVLASMEWSQRNNRSLLFIGTGGCWGWRGRIGITENAKGERVDEKGVLPDFDLLEWQDREVIIAFDSNAVTNAKVRAARWALAEELAARGARVSFATLPQVEGVNGPDDCIAICGDQVLAAVLDKAALFADAAQAEAAAMVEAIELTVAPVERNQVARLYSTLAVVEDADTRNLLVARAAKALRGTITKADVIAGVALQRELLLRQRNEIQEQARVASLVRIAVNPAALIRTLETFFAERVFLPAGAALLLAFFVLLTWTFELFDTCPYVSLESAVPECGKSTVLRAINAVCARGEISTSLTEAVMFRLIDECHPTFLIDEAETIEGRGERAQSLRAIAHEGYKRGGSVARIEGEDRHVRRFDVFCPKVFAAIGGLTGALLSRCIVIHMTRCPKNVSRKSMRLRALERDAKPLREMLEAYSLQFQSELTKLYDEEPDAGYWPAITDREAEIFGPLLIHSRLAGTEIEAELLQVVQAFNQEKQEIMADDWRISQIIALRDAIQNQPEFARFFPADLIDELSKSEAWAQSFAKLGDGDAGKRAKAVKVGKFLRTFRLKPRRESQGSSYLRDEAIKQLSAHIPPGAHTEQEITTMPEELAIATPDGDAVAATVSAPGTSEFFLITETER